MSHVALSRPFKPTSHPGQTSVAAGHTFIDNKGKPVYEVANVLNSRHNSRSGRLEYLVEWLGYKGTDKQTSWEPKTKLEGAQESLEDFRARYPDKPSVDSIKLRHCGGKWV